DGSLGVEKSSRKKTEKKLAAREEAELLAGFMGIMNNMRKQKERYLLIVLSLLQPWNSEMLNLTLNNWWNSFITTRISVNSNNVQSLLDAANQYQIEPQVDASNCLGISVLAECLDCPELKATADDFIHQHFTEVYKTDEFLQLDVKRVTHLLKQDTLEWDQVYDAAVRWLKYDEPNGQPFMVDILAKVRFPLLSKNFLSKTVQAEPLIQDNTECLKMVV
ncbi:hypothetical protein E2I00_020170, partial [Balaenoptera physalus]